MQVRTPPSERIRLASRPRRAPRPRPRGAGVPTAKDPESHQRAPSPPRSLNCTRRRATSIIGILFGVLVGLFVLLGLRCGVLLQLLVRYEDYDRGYYPDFQHG